jgi:hypothetical protein
MPDRVRADDHVATIVTDTEFRREMHRNPQIAPSVLPSRQTCDPETSSRAWRSSPCSSWSPFGRSVRWVPAQSPPWTQASSERWRQRSRGDGGDDPAAGSRSPVRRHSGRDNSVGGPGTSNGSAAGRFDPPEEADGGSISKNVWRHDQNISWYGPGLYGNGTACGQKLTKDLVGVAHRTLPCGTLVTFRYKGITLTVPVIDRGPYVSSRTWDLSHGACAKLHHCFTGTIDWKFPGG